MIYKYIFAGNIVSKILVKNQKLLILVIHGTEVHKKYISLHISLYTEQIWCAVDNKYIYITSKIISFIYEIAHFLTIYYRKSFCMQINQNSGKFIRLVYDGRVCHICKSLDGFCNQSELRTQVYHVRIFYLVFYVRPSTLSVIL